MPAAWSGISPCAAFPTHNAYDALPHALTRSLSDCAPQLQPPVMPRPDVASLGIAYRRIPILAIGRDVYHDTRLIIQKLEALYPASAAHPPIAATAPEHQALEELLEAWTIDGGMFARAAQLIPTSMPLLRDEKFTKDREQYTGRSWSATAIEAMRPEAVPDVKRNFAFLEKTLLADRRQWILGTDGPTLADIQGKSGGSCAGCLSLLGAHGS
jgi:glutathione S-transferase